MRGLPLAHHAGGGRFPGLDVMSHSDDWDEATAAVVQSRLGLLPDIRFFSPAEEGTAAALFDLLLDQRTEPRIPVVQIIDARLADLQTDGWHYDDMPKDAEAWRRSLAGLDEDARAAGCDDFAAADWDTGGQILQTIEELGNQQWHGMTAARVWGLWTRYACSAFYSHPWAWDEIGFSGPAYPRGYKNMGVGKLEGFEVPDARPEADPTKVPESAPKAKQQSGGAAGTGGGNEAGNGGGSDPVVKEPESGPSGKDRNTGQTEQEKQSAPDDGQQGEGTSDHKPENGHSGEQNR